MPINKSVKKALRQSEKRMVKNKRQKRDLKTNLKAIERAVASGDNIKAAGLMPTVTKKLDKAAKRGLIKKNTASRKKSRLAKSLNKISAES